MMVRSVGLRGIHKSFKTVRALQGVDFVIRSGEVHALLGENGAGKTTLMKIMSGLTRPDSGTIEIDGNPVEFSSPFDAGKCGIGMVHQHFMLVPTLSLVNNVALAQNRILESKKALKLLRSRIEALLERTGLEVPLDVEIQTLSVGEQQRAEIVRALMTGSQFLVLDEPTANLAPSEVVALLAQIRQITERDGVGVVIITHHLDEALNVADEITVLRDGLSVGSVAASEVVIDDLARMMVGREISRGSHEYIPAISQDCVIELSEVSALSERRTEALNSVNLKAHAGQIYAIVGVEGNGQVELEHIFSGLLRPNSGVVTYMGEQINSWSPRQRLNSGIVSVPSDRYRSGLISDLSIAHNLILDRFHTYPFKSKGLLVNSEIDLHASSVIERMSIKASSSSIRASTLSGGHAQRVVLGRAIRKGIRLMVACQPTRGLDIGAIEFVWSQLRELRQSGVGIVLITSDLEEAMSIADRIGVLYRGKIISEYDRGAFDRGAIGRAMGGVCDVRKN